MSYIFVLNIFQFLHIFSDLFQTLPIKPYYSRYDVNEIPNVSCNIRNTRDIFIKCVCVFRILSRAMARQVLLHRPRNLFSQRDMNIDFPIVSETSTLSRQRD